MTLTKLAYEPSAEPAQLAGSRRRAANENGGSGHQLMLGVRMWAPLVGTVAAYGTDADGPEAS